jgi:YmgG-like glycine-zipper protein
MHRSRLSVLVIFAAMAACSSHDDSEGTELLSHDRTLAAQIETDNEARQMPLPAACGTAVVAAQPAAANQSQARELTRRGQDAEIQGNIQEARSLLRRAFELDGTSKSTAYHLGRTSEELGDRTAAMTAYCRYLALRPTMTESSEARQRVARLSQSVTTGVAAGSVGESMPAARRTSVATVRRLTRARPASERRVVASAGVEQSAVPASQEVYGASSGIMTESDAVPTPDPLPSVEQPSTTSRSARRGPSSTQSAILGAATGAIIGAATGRSVKSAVIGAAAGGVLGTVVGRIGS